MIETRILGIILLAGLLVLAASLAGCKVYQGEPTLKAELEKRGTCDIQCKRIAFEGAVNASRTIVDNVVRSSADYRP